MMAQYFEIKKQYPGVILFFRLGDFYEMFFDDAKIASRVLDLVLTGKDCGQGERAPMCGVPFHSSDSYIAKLVPNGTMGGMSVLMTTFLGVKFIVKPVMTTKEKRLESSRKKQIIQSVVSGALVGFICGFIGAGGGMMMLLVLTSFLGYELKTAVGTSVFIMTFTALTGALSHFVIGGIPDIQCLVLCIISTLVFAQIASKLANKASPKTLNRAVGVILVILGISMMIIKFVK